MPGTALVTIGENQWSVEVASSTPELISGLSGRASIPAGTGMLFILPVRQPVTVQTNEMLFPIDIIFIKDNIVLDVVQNVEPELLVEEATPCDGFLEINVGESALVELDDAVDVEFLYTVQAPGFDWSSIISFALPLVVLAFVFGMLPSKGSSSNPKRLKGNKQSKGTVECPICGEIIEIPEYNKTTRSDALSKHINEKHGFEHRSIHGKPRQRLVEQYGSWAVGRAEAVCPEDDVMCVEKEAKRLSEVYRSRYGEEGMEYVTIISAGQTVFHIGDVVSSVALEKENKRVRALGENEATYQISQAKTIPMERYTRKKEQEIPEEIEFLPDSPEFLAYTIKDIGYNDKLENAFKERMLRVRND